MLMDVLGLMLKFMHAINMHDIMDMMKGRETWHWRNREHVACSRTNRTYKNRSRIKTISLEVNLVNNSFNSNCEKFSTALSECAGLKSEYKHTVSELCKEFKATVTEDTDAMIIKGYKQQVKLIKIILEKIELLISDYNIKKNKVEEDNKTFGQLYGSVNSLLTQLLSKGGKWCEF